MKTKTLLGKLTTLACLAAATQVHAGTHIWSGLVNNAWSQPGNWSSGGAPQFGEANIVLIFPPNLANRAATNGIGNLAIDDIIITGDNYKIGGYGITLTGAGYYNIDCSDVNNEIALDIMFNSNLEYFNLGPSGYLTLSGALSGSGGFFKWGPGVLRLTGGTANTYAAPTYMNGGTLLLGKSFATTAIPGPFYIAQTNAAANYADIPKTNVVRLLAGQQIADNAPIYMQASAKLDMNGYSESVGMLTMIGSVITNNGGTLTLKSNVTFGSPWNNSPRITGNVSLGGATRTFTSLEPGALFLYGVISDGGAPAGITKMGLLGGLGIEGTNNTYTGVTTINEGWLSVEQPGSLGSPMGGTVVNSNAELSVGLNFYGPVETLTMNDGSKLYSVGINSWDGNISVNGDATIVVDTAASDEVLDITGVISGSGNLHFPLGGTMRFSGNSPNTYTGSTFVSGSTIWGRVTTLELRKPAGVTAIPGPLFIGTATNPPNNEIVKLFAPNQIADTSAVTIDKSGGLIFDTIGAQSETIGSLSGGGNVTLALATLTVGGNNSDSAFSGGIGGVGFTSIIKEGTGKLTLTGTNTCSGKMIVNNGHLYVNGSQTCGVQLNSNGKLHGQGVVGNITGLGGWTIPGDNLIAPNHGQLKSGTLNLDSVSDFNVDLGGTAASGKYDRLKVSGSVMLGDAALHLSQSAMAKTNDQFIIIDNDGADAVIGTFSGLTNNAIFALGPQQVFKISYTGGDGNDVVLTQLVSPPPPTMGGVTVLPNGQVEITGSGMPNWQYTVEATEEIDNANSWQAIGVAVADVNGVIKFTDPDAPKHQMRFYRLKAI